MTKGTTKAELDRQNKALRAQVAGLLDGMAQIESYLNLPKFHEDTTVQTNDIRLRLVEAAAEGEARKASVEQAFALWGRLSPEARDAVLALRVDDRPWRFEQMPGQDRAWRDCFYGEKLPDYGVSLAVIRELLDVEFLEPYEAVPGLTIKRWQLNQANWEYMASLLAVEALV